MVFTAIALTVDNGVALHSLKSSMKNGKKTSHLWKKSNVSGTTILCGMVSAMNSREPSRNYGKASKGSGEHSDDLMAMQQPFFLATPEAKSFQI